MRIQEPGGTNEKIIMISLLEMAVYTALWLWNDFIAFYTSLILPAMVFLLLIFSAIADWIEPSRMPRWFYIIMFVSIIIPLVVAGFFYFLQDGVFDFLRPL